MPVAEREQRRDGERDRQRDQRVVDAVRAEDADRIGAEPDEGRMAERDQRAVADQQIERERRDGEDHHARDEAQHIGFGLERGEQRHAAAKSEKDRDRQGIAGEQRASRVPAEASGGVRHRQRPFAGNRPAGRK